MIYYKFANKQDLTLFLVVKPEKTMRRTLRSPHTSFHCHQRLHMGESCFLCYLPTAYLYRVLEDQRGLFHILLPNGTRFYKWKQLNY